MSATREVDATTNPQARALGDHHRPVIAQSASTAPSAEFVHRQHRTHERSGQNLVGEGTLPAPGSVLKGADQHGGTTDAPKDGDDVKDPARLFPKMQMGQIVNAKDGKRYMRLGANSGGERQIVEDPAKGTWNETVLNPDGTKETIDAKRGFSEHKTWDAKHNLRSDEVSESRTQDNKYNYTHKKEWDAGHVLREDSTRYQDATGKWHEDSTYNFTNGIRRHQVMDGDRTTTTDFKKDNSYDQTVITRNVPVENPVRGGQKTTMKVAGFHYDAKTQKVTPVDYP